MAQTTTFFVPHSLLNQIVGRGGSTLRDLRSRFSVDIQLPKPDEEVSCVTVSGTEEGVESCRQALEELLNLPVGTEPLQTITLGVPRRRYGAIIGAQGATLKGLMKECRAAIDVPRADAPGDVTVQGLPADCARAQEKIEELVRDKVPVLDTKTGAPAKMPRPPGFDLATKEPIRYSLFFPDSGNGSEGSAISTFLKFLDSPLKTCDVCVYTITDDRISRRLLDAKRLWGVRVRIITDIVQAEAQGSDIHEFEHAGIEVRMGGTPECHMHHKFCILDGTVLMNGSFNWTSNASGSNSENVMVTNEVVFVQPFQQHFEERWATFAPK